VVYFSEVLIGRDRLIDGIDVLPIGIQRSRYPCASPKLGAHLKSTTSEEAV
jgi:hypothetical protein